MLTRSHVDLRRLYQHKLVNIEGIFPAAVPVGSDVTRRPELVSTLGTGVATAAFLRIAAVPLNPEVRALPGRRISRREWVFFLIRGAAALQAEHRRAGCRVTFHPEWRASQTADRNF